MWLLLRKNQDASSQLFMMGNHNPQGGPQLRGGGGRRIFT